MKTLKVQIAEAIIESCEADERPMPKRWRIQTPSGGYRRVAMFFDLANNPDPFERARIAEHKRLSVGLPSGYSESEYEEALNELFPGTLDNDYTVPEYNYSVRIITRKAFEDRISYAISSQSGVLPAFRASSEWSSVLGVGWMRTPAFIVSVSESGERTDFYARSADGDRNALIVEKNTKRVEENGYSAFNFDDPYTLVDRQNGFIEEIEILKTGVGSYGVRFRRAPAEFSLPLKTRTGGW